MKKGIRRMVMSMALLGLLGACGKDPLPDPDETPLRFSILGDSFSAFEGYVDPDSNDFLYGLPPYNYSDVSCVEDMWWYQVATILGWEVEKNNSFAGSLICNYWGFNAGPYYRQHSFIHRMDHLGNPDVIFVFGGTNDVWSGAYSGEFVYSDWTEGDLEQYRPALAYLFDHLRQRYPAATIYLLLDMDIAYVEVQDFVESAHRIAFHYRIKCIDLHDIHKEIAHPNAQGMNDIAIQVVTALLKSVNV